MADPKMLHIARRQHLTLREPHDIALGLPQNIDDLDLAGAVGGQRGAATEAGGEGEGKGRRRWGSREGERASMGRRVKGLGLGMVGGGQCKIALRGALKNNSIIGFLLHRVEINISLKIYVKINEHEYCTIGMS